MRTKTIATLGPSCSDYETMKQMVEYGVRIFRLNFSHASASEFVPAVENIRRIESELDIPLTAMGDLCGPKIRIGEVAGSPVHIEESCTVLLGPPDKADHVDGHCAYISLDMPELLSGLAEGMRVSLSDGMLEFTIQEVLVKDELYVMQALSSGLLTSHKGIAFPGKFHPMPALTEKDRRDLHEGLDIGIDALALSFVQHKEDIADIKREIESHGVWVPVVAKIERKNAVDNLESILPLTDAIMVARGDLGLECSLAALPVIQKRIIRQCRHHQKACIVATQMLLSMVSNPMPTRAESTDVANAIFDGADCVMLSEETAVGSYPVKAVKFIQEIAHNAEQYYLERLGAPYAPNKSEKNLAKYMSYSASLIAENSDACAIVSHSTSGATTRLMSSRRPRHPMYCLTPREPVMRYMNYFWGVLPRLVDKKVENHLERAQNFVQGSSEFKRGETVIITSGQPTPGQERIQTNEIKVYTK